MRIVLRVVAVLLLVLFLPMALVNLWHLHEALKSHPLLNSAVLVLGDLVILASGYVLLEETDRAKWMESGS